MTARQQRRLEERKARKDARKGQSPDSSGNVAAVPQSENPTTQNTRAHINRTNAQHSTGPRTAEGKSASSRNAFKHGLYSKKLMLPGEDPAELDSLRDDLRREHQPTTTTEEILVNEIAEHYWRLRRMRKFEARAMSADNFETGLAILPIIQRTMASAERGFHKALKTLTELQRQRGFVPQTAPHHPEEGTQSTSARARKTPPPPPQPEDATDNTGFVSQNTLETADLSPVDLQDLLYIDAA